MITNKEMSLSIRRELKENGYNIKDFKVSVKDSGYNTAIKITIKNPHINKKGIENILSKYESIETCKRTNEVLDGCNIYLFVEYEYRLFDEVAQEWASTAKGLMIDKNEKMRIFNGLYLINDKKEKYMRIMQQDANEHCTRIICNFNELCEYLYKFAEFGSINI